MIRSSGQKSLPAIGFLTIIRDTEHGLFGGYLVLNSLGRPLEFHCTAPVRPNRAQEILYGPTLEPYLYGERIGPALLEKAKSEPIAVLTDIPTAMTTRQFVPTPMMLVLGESVRATGPSSDRSSVQETGCRPDTPHRPLRNARGALCHFSLGTHQLAVDSQHPEDESVLVSSWAQFTEQVDLKEPFSRIREAIDEARRGASA